MTVVAHRWLVSTQTHGEVLTARAEAPGVTIMLLGLPAGFTPLEVETWLDGLVRAVDEGSGSGTPEDPIPPILRQALNGLLFSHGEIWTQRGPRTSCSLVLVDRDGRLGFGWVGEAAVEILRDGVPVAPEWLRVSDPRGREARAWRANPEQEIRIELAATVDHGTGAAVRVVALWSPETQEAPRAPDPRSAPLEERGTPASPSKPAMLEPRVKAPPQEDLPSAGVARWLAQHLDWQADPALPASPGDESEPAALPVTEVGGFSPTEARVEEIVLPPSVPDLIPPAPEPSVPSTSPTVLAARAPEEPAERAEKAARELRARTPRRPSWPVQAPTPLERPMRWKKPTLWAALGVALLGLGWVFGTFQSPDASAPARSSGFVSFLRTIGLAGPRFEARIESEPPGAWIAVDGKELAVRTPATLELKPGEHRVELFFPELGRASHVVTGKKNERTRLNAALWGTLEVVTSHAGTVVNVAVDGESKGFAPLTIERLAPGPHELRFTGPGMASWGTTVEVRIGETREVLAYPLQSPATGVLQVRATQNVEGETQPLAGARVWIDGEPRGVTPLTLELPRGPHSVRSAFRQEEGPVQLIDLPGGNQRFANFEFGLDLEVPRLQIKAPARMSLEEPALISATLTPVTASEVKEMWLHVRTPENRWRRYPMTLLDAQGSAVGASPFPVALLAPGQKTPYYVSALTSQGDEYFTELLKAEPATPRR